MIEILSTILAMATVLCFSAVHANAVEVEFPEPVEVVVTVGFEVATSDGVELVLDEGTVVTLKDSDMVDELGDAVVVLPDTSRTGDVLEDASIKNGCGFGAETVWIAHAGDRVYTHGHKWGKLNAVTVCHHGESQTACDGWISMKDVRLED